MSNDCSAWWSDLIKRSATEGTTSEYLAWCEFERLTDELATWKRQDAMHKREADDWQAHHGVLENRLAEKDRMIEGYQYNLGEKIERIEELEDKVALMYHAHRSIEMNEEGVIRRIK